MTYNISLTFEVKRLASLDEAQDFATAIAEHVADTFNDDQTISPYYSAKIEKKVKK
jgi:hypothetical protein